MLIRFNSKILWRLKVFLLMVFRQSALVTSVCKHLKERVASRSCHSKNIFYELMVK